MIISDRKAISKLDQAIERYAIALSAIEEAAPNPSVEQVLEVLKARDAVKAARTTEIEAPSETLAKLIDLDSRLKTQAKAIASFNKLATCRQSLDPPESAWWWFLDAPPRSQPKWARFNWVWNTLTVACLVGATTYTIETAKVFSKNGFDLLQTLTTLTQGAALALVAGGTLTDKGRQAVRNTLSSLKISPYLDAEATFAASAVLLAASYGIYTYLPEVGEWYYQQGTLDYNKGQLLKAKEKYEEAIHLAPERPAIHVALGKIYETLGQLDAAKSQYQIGLLKNDPASYNGLGRVTLEMSDDPDNPKKAEGYFVRALDRENISENLKAQLHTNLGVAQLEQIDDADSTQQIQNLLYKARQNFEQALAIEQSIPETTPQRGIAHCYLAILPQGQQASNQMVNHAELCKKANPQTLGDFAQLVALRKRDVSDKINQSPAVTQTSAAVAPGNEEFNPTDVFYTAPQITDPSKLEELKLLLFAQIDENWKTFPTFQQNLVYRVKVNDQGTLSSFEATDRLAEDFINETPLPTLPKSDSTSEPIAEFTVTFTPEGRLEVTP